MHACMHVWSCDWSILIGYQVDLGGSLAVASKGLFATGVSTDLSGRLFSFGSVFGVCTAVRGIGRMLTDGWHGVVTYLSTGGKIGDTLRAVCNGSPWDDFTAFGANGCEGSVV